MIEALPEEFDRLLRGAVDVHVHGQPDLSAAFPNRGDDLAVIRLAHAYGITGWVLKSHLWITTDRAARLREQVADLGFEIYGSVTLNPPMGGVSATRSATSTRRCPRSAPTASCSAPTPSPAGPRPSPSACEYSSSSSPTSAGSRTRYAA